MVDGLELYGAEFVGRGVEFVVWIGFLEGEVCLETLDPALWYGLVESSWRGISCIGGMRKGWM